MAEQLLKKTDKNLMMGEIPCSAGQLVSKGEIILRRGNQSSLTVRDAEVDQHGHSPAVTASLPGVLPNAGWVTLSSPFPLHFKICWSDLTQPVLLIPYLVFSWQLQKIPNSTTLV